MPTAPPKPGAAKTDDEIADELGARLDSLAPKTELEAVRGKLELAERGLEDIKKQIASGGVFNIITDAGKLDPENNEDIRKSFYLPAIASAAYYRADGKDNPFEEVEKNIDNSYIKKRGLGFERDVCEIRNRKRYESLMDAPAEHQRAFAAQRAQGAERLDLNKSNYRAVQTTTIGSDGGYLVSPQLGWYDEIIRNKMLLTTIGVETVQATGIPFYWNTQTAAASGAYITPETGAMGSSSITVGQKAAYPREWGLYIAASRRALKFASPDLEGIIRNELVKIAMLNRQAQLLRGTGLLGAPSGVLTVGTTSSQSTTSRTTLMTAVSKTEIAMGDLPSMNLAWVTSTGFKNYVKLLINTSAEQPFYSDAHTSWITMIPNIEGHPLFHTGSFVNTDNSAEGSFGPWDMAKIIDFGMELVVSKELLWTKQQVAFGVMDNHEIIFRRPELFMKWADGDAIP